MDIGESNTISRKNELKENELKMKSGRSDQQSTWASGVVANI